MWLQEATGLDGYKSWMALGIFLGHNRVLSQCNIQQHCVTSYQDIMTKTCDKEVVFWQFLGAKSMKICYMFVFYNYYNNHNIHYI